MLVKLLNRRSCSVHRLWQPWKRLDELWRRSSDGRSRGSGFTAAQQESWRLRLPWLSRSLSHIKEQGPQKALQEHQKAGYMVAIHGGKPHPAARKRTARMLMPFLVQPVMSAV